MGEGCGTGRSGIAQAAAPRARACSAPERMLSIKVGCSAPREGTSRGMAGPKVGCSAPGRDAQPLGRCSALGRMAHLPQHCSPAALVGWDAWLLLHMDPTHPRSGMWYPLWEEGCGRAISKTPQMLFHLWFCRSTPSSSLCALVLIPWLQLGQRGWNAGKGPGGAGTPPVLGAALSP